MLTDIAADLDYDSLIRGNFLYDKATGRINLIDFGAAREYPAAFVGDYLEMVMGCADRNRQQVITRSTSLGFLTGMNTLFCRSLCM